MQATHSFAASLRGSLLAAFATASAAALPINWLANELLLPVQLFLGAVGFAVVLWLLELRGRIAQVGDGLAAAEA